MWIRHEPEDPRRRLVLAALSAGVFAVGPGRALGFFHRKKTPEKLPEGRSFHEIRGGVRVNGAQATMDTVLQAGDSIVTDADGRAIFVIGQDAFILRESSRLETEGGGFLVERLRLLTGALLSVLGSYRHQIMTTVASVGIRGTGLYVEAEPDRTYVCTCYGVTELAAVADPASTEVIESEHHDEPRFIRSAGPAGTRIQPAPVINHTDEELILIEALVGRVPPFGTDPGVYQRDPGDDR